MFKKIVVLAVLLVSMTLKPAEVKAQLVIAEVIKAGVKKIVKAVDLKVQRLQNKTIWLQNAQKVLENKLSKFRLGEISDWTEKQRTLYRDYFDELNKVKSAISYYHRIRDIGSKQSHLLKAYRKAWELSKRDPNFSPVELEYMSRVYGGILNASLKNIDQIITVIKPFEVQMTDAERLKIIRETANAIDQNYYDLIAFNRQNTLLSISRAKDNNEANQIRRWYGIKTN